MARPLGFQVWGGASETFQEKGGRPVALGTVQELVVTGLPCYRSATCYRSAVSDRVWLRLCAPTSGHVRAHGTVPN